MPTTKPDTETGWSKDDPKVDGVYWWRADPDDPEPDIHQVSGSSFFEPGHRAAETVENYGGEWLGPISPSDFEQLRRLRKAAALCAIPYEALLADSKSKKWIAPKVWTAIKSAVDALREALTSVNNLRDEKPPHAATSMRSACVEKVKEFDDWVWCKCSECRADAGSHAVDVHASLFNLATELESLTLQEQEAKQS